MLTLMATAALAVMCALDALRTSITIRIGCWLKRAARPRLPRLRRARAPERGSLGALSPCATFPRSRNFHATARG